MQVTQRFTGVGLLGAILFVAGPIVSGFGYLRTIGGSFVYRTDPSVFSQALVIAGIGTLATLISVPMLIVGREYHVDERALRAARTNSPEVDFLDEAASPAELPTSPRPGRMIRRR